MATMKELLYRKPLVFIADDDPDDVYFVRTAIEELDMDIQLRHFFNGQQLLQELGKNGEQLPNFVLLDLNMPVMNGKEALRLIRKSARYNDLPVIVFTTSNLLNEKNLCYSYGATNYITKPSNYSRYLEIIKKLKSDWIDHEVVYHSENKAS